MSELDVKRIAVIGGGTMGLGIAHVAAHGGYDVTLFDVGADQLATAVARIRKNLDKGVELGKTDAEAAAATMDRIRTDTDFDAAVKDADMMIEAVPERLDLKRELFARADRLMRPEAVLASNTSGLSITAIGAATARPAQVIGMHFFNPVHIMRLIEIIRSKDTSDATYRTTEAVSKRMGKETVEVNESAGFVTSRVNALIGNEAFRMWEEGVATPEDIDKALKLGLNHPMGPFELVDLVGLDVRAASLANLHEHLGETYRASPLIRRLVEQGRLGKKVGHGVYRYDAQGRRVPEPAQPPTAGA